MHRSESLLSHATGRDARDWHFHEFSLFLCSMAAPASEGDLKRRRAGSGLGADEQVRQNALAALIGSIGPNQHVIFESSAWRNEAGVALPVVRVVSCAAAQTPELAREAACTLQSNVRAMLDLGFAPFRFQPSPPGAARRQCFDAWSCSAVAWPLAMAVDGGHSAGFGTPAPPSHLLLPMAMRPSQSYLDDVLSCMLAARQSMALRVTLSGRQLSAQAVGALRHAADHLASIDLARMSLDGMPGEGARPSAEDIAATQAMLRRWCQQPSGVELEVSLHSEQPVPDVLARMLLGEVLSGRAFTLRPASQRQTDRDELDLRSYLPATAGAPPLLPAPSSLVQTGLTSHPVGPIPPWQEEGLVLGDALTPFGEQPLRLGPSSAYGHIYILGVTGVAKSTLMRRLIRDDVEAGRGMLLMEGHGDLAEEVLSDIPPERFNDIVRLDFTLEEHVPGLNLLQLGAGRTDLERNFAIQAIADIIWQMNKYMPESVGPMFFMYMRQAIALLMNALRELATLLDVPRLFAEPAYLQYLLQRCDDPSLVTFWRGLALATTGEASMSSIGPYIVNKVTEFTENARMEPIIGQSSSTFDPRQFMDERKLVVVNLAKGVLGERDSRLLGMLMVSRLFSAALSRADVSSAERPPFRIYIDEFADYAVSDALEAMLSEARKYGVALTLAHQGLDQLGHRLRAAVLGNASTRFFFRVGAPDAEALASYVAPHFKGTDLASLPNFHALACLSPSGVPQPPVVLRTQPAAARVAAPETLASRAGAIARATLRHSRPVSEVRAEIAANRDAYLRELRVSGLQIDATSVAALADAGVTTLGQLAQMEATQRQELLAGLKSIRDRVRLKELLARAIGESIAR